MEQAYSVRNPLQVAVQRWSESYKYNKSFLIPRRVAVVISAETMSDIAHYERQQVIVDERITRARAQKAIKV